MFSFCGVLFNSEYSEQPYPMQNDCTKMHQSLPAAENDNG